MIQAKDVMTKSVVSVKTTTPLLEALDLLLSKSISGLPVVDDEDHLVGMLTEKDLLKLFVGEGFDRLDLVASYMTKNVISFNEDESVVVICDFFINNTIRRVPIVSDGKLAGILSRREILKLISQSANKHK